MSNSYRHVFWQSTPHPATWRKWHDTWRLTGNKDDTYIPHVYIAKKQMNPTKRRELPPSIVPRREMVEIFPRWKYQSPPGPPSTPMLCSDTWITIIYRLFLENQVYKKHWGSKRSYLQPPPRQLIFRRNRAPAYLAPLPLTSIWQSSVGD